MPSSSFIQIQTHPPFRVKLARITAPQFLRHVDANDGDADETAFGDEDAVDELAGCGPDWLGKWEDVVFIDLPPWKMKRSSKESARHNCSHPYSARVYQDVSLVLQM